jgi:23S rRNA pseudouridine2605 synthase
MRAHRATRQVGLARALSKLGYCSRSQASGLIRAGRVTLNGKVRRDPETPVAGTQSQIAVDGKIVETPTKLYLMMNKPRGVITTAADEKGRNTVYTLLSKNKNARVEPAPWVAPVGRLDKASEGLLLLTNDSEWGARIAAPETHLDKTYHVQVNRVVDAEFVQTLTRGVDTKDGEVLCAKQARLLRAGEKNCWLEIVLDEGRNRQIRRMMEVLGVEVLRLLRVAIGPLRLGDLAKGGHRALTAGEKRSLDRAMQGRA